MLKELLSVQTGKHTVLNQLSNGESFLLLYDDRARVKDIFVSFLEKELRNGRVCFYASEVGELKPRKDLFIYSFQPNVEFQHLEKFEGKFENICKGVEKKGSELRLFVDWGNIKNYLKEEDEIASCIERIINRKFEKIPKPWKRKFKSIQRAFPIMVLNAFDLDYISSEFLNQLFQMHDRVIIINKNEIITSLPGFSLVGGGEKHLRPVK